MSRIDVARERLAAQIAEVERQRDEAQAQVRAKQSWIEGAKTDTLEEGDVLNGDFAIPGIFGRGEGDSR